MSGAYAKFRLYIEIFKEIDFRTLTFGLVIYDKNEIKIADFYSNEVGLDFNKIPSYVDLEIPKLMLRGGDSVSINYAMCNTVTHTLLLRSQPSIPNTCVILKPSKHLRYLEAGTKSQMSARFISREGETPRV